MNRVILMGRLTKDPVVRYNGEMAIARYTLAVNRKGDEADYIGCVAFGRNGEFAEKYLKQGMKMLIFGHIQTGKYDKDGQTVYTTDVVVDEHEFCESKKSEPPFK